MLLSRGQHLRNDIPHRHLGREPRRWHRCGRRGLSPAPATHRGGPPAGSGPAPTRPEPPHHPARRVRHGRDPFGPLRGPHHRYPHSGAGPERRCPPGRLRAPQGRLQALTRRLHLRRQVRNPQLAGRWEGQRTGDDRPRRGRRDRTAPSSPGGRYRGPGVGQQGPHHRRRRGCLVGDPRTGGGRSDPLPRSGRRGCDDLRHRGCPARRRLPRGHRHLCSAKRAPRVGGSGL